MPSRFLFRALILSAFAAMTAACDRDAAAGCFLPGATPPLRAAMLADPALGASARELAAALFDRDLPKAETLLKGDRALANVRVGAHHDMLTVALGSCEPRAVELVLHYGAAPDGTSDSGVPLGLALMAQDPALAHALLEGGARATPVKNPLGPFRTAITAGSIGGVRMLLDFRGDPNAADRLGHTPLLIALDTERFRIAELLLDRGADPWAIDSTGGNLGTSAYTKMVTTDGEEAEAQRRLQVRLTRLDWPTPPPSPAQIRRLAQERQWPPAGVEARPVPSGVLQVIEANGR